MSAARRLIPLALVALSAASASAHEPPRGIGLLWANDAASSPSVIVANRGLVYVEETDAGPRFSLRCAEAYGANIADRPGVFLTPSGAVVVGVYNGVFTSSDQGCSFSPASGLPTDTGETLGNLAAAAGMPGRMFVSTRTFSGYAAVFQSDDYGRTWTERFENPPDHQFDVLLATPAAPQRLYAAGRWRDLAKQQLNFVTASSLDLGASWQELAAPLKAAAFAVHPGNADVVFAYQPTDTLETVFRLLRSADRGANFVPVLEGIARPTVIAAAAEAGALWLGVDGKGGLYRSSDDGQHFEKVFVNDVQSVSCLAQRQGRLWMCANLAPNSNGVWYSDDDGVSFRRWMIFEDVRQQVPCSGDALTACARAWYDYDIELHPPGVDAGWNAPWGLNLDAGPREAGTAGQPADAGAADGSVPADAEAASDAGAVADAQIVSPPGSDASGGFADAGSALDAGGTQTMQAGATAGEAGSARDGGSDFRPPRHKRRSEGCNAGPGAALDSCGIWLLGAGAWLARVRRPRRR